MIQSTMFLTKSLVKNYFLNFFLRKLVVLHFNDLLNNALHCNVFDKFKGNSLVSLSKEIVEGNSLDNVFDEVEGKREDHC